MPACCLILLVTVFDTQFQASTYRSTHLARHFCWAVSKLDPGDDTHILKHFSLIVWTNNSCCCIAACICITFKDSSTLDLFKVGIPPPLPASNEEKESMVIIY